MVTHTHTHTDHLDIGRRLRNHGVHPWYVTARPWKRNNIIRYQIPRATSLCTSKTLRQFRKRIAQGCPVDVRPLSEYVWLDHSHTYVPGARSPFPRGSVYKKTTTPEKKKYIFEKSMIPFTKQNSKSKKMPRFVL